MSGSQSLISEAFLRYALKIGALKISEAGFTLKSGRVSPYFFNSGLFTKGEDIRVLTDLYVNAFQKLELHIDVIFGPAYKGIPLAYSVAQGIGGCIEWSANRKEAKDHGDGGNIMGASLRGKQVLIIDDVITSGLSFREAIDIIRSHGGFPVAGFVGFDRQEKGKESDKSAIQSLMDETDIQIYSSVCLDNLISLLQRLTPASGDGESVELIQKILAYKKKYGVNWVKFSQTAFYNEGGFFVF